jgi:hypothetical protein
MMPTLTPAEHTGKAHSMMHKITHEKQKMRLIAQNPLPMIVTAMKPQANLMTLTHMQGVHTTRTTLVISVLMQGGVCTLLKPENGLLNIAGRRQRASK